jgi:hypothetical protein
MQLLLCQRRVWYHLQRTRTLQCLPKTPFQCYVICCSRQGPAGQRCCTLLQLQLRQHPGMAGRSPSLPVWAQPELRACLHSRHLFGAAGREARWAVSARCCLTACAATWYICLLLHLAPLPLLVAAPCSPRRWWPGRPGAAASQPHRPHPAVRWRAPPLQAPPTAAARRPRPAQQPAPRPRLRSGVGSGWL